MAWWICNVPFIAIDGSIFGTLENVLYGCYDMNTPNRAYVIDCSGHYLLHRYLGVTKIAWNGELHDFRQTLCLAMGGHESDDCIRAIAYTTSNGGPTVVATATILGCDPHSATWNHLDWEIMADCDGEPLPLEPWVSEALATVCGIGCPLMEFSVGQRVRVITGCHSGCTGVVACSYVGNTEPEYVVVLGGPVWSKWYSRSELSSKLAESGSDDFTSISIEDGKSVLEVKPDKPSCASVRCVARDLGFSTKRLDGEWEIWRTGETRESSYFTEDNEDAIATMCNWNCKPAEPAIPASTLPYAVGDPSRGTLKCIGYLVVEDDRICSSLHPTYEWAVKNMIYCYSRAGLPYTYCVLPMFA